MSQLACHELGGRQLVVGFASFECSDPVMAIAHVVVLARRRKVRLDEAGDGGDAHLGGSQDAGGQRDPPHCSG